MATTTLYEKKFHKLTGDAQEQNSKSSAIYGMINPLKWCYSAIKDRNVSDIINLHEYAAEFVGKPISVFDSVKIAKAILELNTSR
jgi:glyceraldehyde 3-phosphate dehydrogenase